MTGAGVASDDRPRRRPMRACTARTPARLTPPAPLPPRKVTPTKKFVTEKSSPSQPFTPIALSSPLPAQEERWQLRNMWELASVLHFLNVFRPVLGIADDFSGEDLETALLMPNSRLGYIHIILLKAVPPVHRTSLNLDTWVTILTKKIQSWWPWVAEGPCPLVPAHGQEILTYKEFDPGTRLIILKALCEIRLDQEDVRLYIEQSLKQGHPVSNFRKDRTGADMFGTTYWYFDDPMLGHRLCRDTRMDIKVKGRIRARDYPPPVAGQWETLATNYEEFHFVAEQLTLSTQRLEAALGKRITSDILPELEEMQKKKERSLKKQQRQAVLLDNLIQGNGLAAGRSRRDRKPVSYTFDDYDRSINEAIKFTKKRLPSPEPAHQQDMKGIYDRSNGANGHSGMYSSHSSGINGNHAPDNGELTNLSSRRRQSRKSQRYSESEYTIGTNYDDDDDDAETSSDDEIEGEAIYDENYLRAKKRRKKVVSSSEGDDEDYRGEDVEESNLEDDDIEDSDEDEDDDDDRYHRSRYQQNRDTGKRKRKEHKLKSVDELQGGLSWGLRRSKRATKSEVDYSKFGDSEFEDEENAVGYRGIQERNRTTTSPGDDSDASFGPSDDSQAGRESDADSEGFQDVKKNKQKLEDLHDRKDVRVSHLHDADDNSAMRSSALGIGQQQHGASFLRTEHSNGGNQSTKYSSYSDTKPRRFLDLNVAAPAGGGFEEAAGCSTHVYADAHGDARSLPAKSDEEDDDYFGDGGRVDVSSGYTNNGFTPSSSFGAKTD